MYTTKPTSQKRLRSDPCLCSVCFKLLGATVLCHSCYQVSVHRKCGNISGSIWTCANCLTVKKEEKTEDSAIFDFSELKKEEKTEDLKCEMKPDVCEQVPVEPDSLKFDPIKDEFAPVLPPTSIPPSLSSAISLTVPPTAPLVPFSIPADHLQAETVFKRVMSTAAADSSLLQLLAGKQTDYNSLYKEFESRKCELTAAKLGDQEFRLALFRLQEKLLSATARVRKELIDQLHSARVFGFEGVKWMKTHSEAPDPPFKELEEYRKVQDKVAEKMLSMAIPNVVVTNPLAKYELIPKKKEGKHKKSEGKAVSMTELLLNPQSKSSVFVLLSKAICDLKQQTSELEEGEFSELMLGAIVKGAVDASISVFEGFRGGSTDPLIQQGENRSNASCCSGGSEFKPNSCINPASCDAIDGQDCHMRCLR